MGLRDAVLDELGLVQHQALPVQGRVLLLVQAQQGVAGDHHVGSLDRRGQRGAALGGGGGQHSQIKSRCETGGLGLPYREHRTGCDHQERRGRRWTGTAGVEEQSEGLDGLAQAHVVGEYPAEPLLVQEREPREALVLIRAQDRFQAGRRGGDGDLLEVREGTHAAAPGHGGGGLVGEVLELLPERDLVPADGRSLRLPLRHGLRLDQQLAQLVEGGVVQLRVGLVRQQHGLPALGEGLEDRGEGHQVLADRDLETEVEPVGAVRAGALDLDDAKVRGAGEFLVAGALAVLDDVHVRQGRNPRQHMLHEGGTLDVVQGGLVGTERPWPQGAHLGEHLLLVVQIPAHGGARDAARPMKGQHAPWCGVHPLPLQVGEVAATVAHHQLQARRHRVGEGDGAVGAAKGHRAAQLRGVVLQEVLGLLGRDLHLLVAAEQGPQGLRHWLGGRGQLQPCRLRGVLVRQHRDEAARPGRAQVGPGRVLGGGGDGGQPEPRTCASDIEGCGDRFGPLDVREHPLAHEIDAEAAGLAEQGPAVRGEGVQPQQFPGVHPVGALGQLQPNDTGDEGGMVTADRGERTAVLELLPGQPALDPVLPGARAQQPQPGVQGSALADVLERGRLGTEAGEPEPAVLGAKLHPEGQRFRGHGGGAAVHERAQQFPPCGCSGRGAAT